MKLCSGFYNGWHEIQIGTRDFDFLLRDALALVFDKEENIL